MLGPQPFRRNPNTQAASWFLDLHSSGRLNLDPPYQRRSVWNYEYRQFFVDSILRNYPTQAIFLEVDVDPDRATEYRVLDGKQRLTSLISFCNNEWPTSSSLVDLNLDNLYYSDLPKEYKRQVLTYVFTVESVEDATPAELNQAFDRLNRNVSRLNRQELRHAQFGGEFIGKMEHLAEDSIWEELGLVTLARRRRMLDVEYVSELYIVAMSGVQDGKDYLDEAYANFDLEIPGEREVDATFRAARTTLTRINDHLSLSQTRYRNVADFYSLWAALVALKRAGTQLEPEGAASHLSGFLEELERQESERARAYLLAARQGSNKGANRSLRAEILAGILASE